MKNIITSVIPILQVKIVYWVMRKFPKTLETDEEVENLDSVIQDFQANIGKYFNAHQPSVISIEPFHRYFI